MTTTDLFIQQLERLRPQIEQAQQRGERVRIKLYAADEVGPPELRLLPRGNIESARGTSLGTRGLATARM